MFGNPEKKAEKAHRKAMKQLRWAFKTAGITEDDLIVAMGNDIEDLMLLTEQDMIWVRRGEWGGGKELGRVWRDQVRGVRREGTYLVFDIEGGSLPKGNKFPYSDMFFANAFQFLDVMCRGRLGEWMTPEEQENPLTFMRELVLDFPRDEPEAQTTAQNATPPHAPTPPATPPQAPPQSAQVQGSESSPEADSDIPGMIRKLGDLRDAGLLTTEEFEMKKQELLRRM